MSSRFYTTVKLGPKREKTPEGFLVCHDVPIARIGTMDYLASELPGAPITPNAHGMFTVERDESEVFRPETIASLNGKPFTNGHPAEDVLPHNWKSLSEGVVLNPRQGTDGLLFADILITHDSAIRDVESGLVTEVSAGYDADYEEIEPGRGRQTNIIFNHVARVPQGRCGTRCSIGDQEMPAPKKRNWRDRVLTAFKAKDEEALHEELDRAESEMSDDDKKDVHVHVHTSPYSTPKSPEDQRTEDGDEPAADQPKDANARISALEQGHREILAQVSKILAHISEQEGPEEEEVSEEEEEHRQKTTDSVLIQDTIARAEILVPGISIPTIDTKAGPQKTRDMLCGFRKKTLRVAYATKDGRELLSPLLRGRTIDSLPCAASSVLFDTASEILKAQNNGRGPGLVRHTTDGARAETLADINRRNQDFWADKR